MALPHNVDGNSLPADFQDNFSNLDSRVTSAELSLAIAGTSSNLLGVDIFDRDGVIGMDSYVGSIVGTTVSVMAGKAMYSNTRVSSQSTLAPSFSAADAVGTWYIYVTNTGAVAKSITDIGTHLYSVYWNGTALSALTDRRILTGPRAVKSPVETLASQGNPTYNTIQELNDINLPAGIISGGVCSYSGTTATFRFTACSILIRATNSDTATLYPYDIAQTDILIAVGDYGKAVYVYADYNAGTPILVQSLVDPTTTANRNSKVFMGAIYWDSVTNYHFTQTAAQRVTAQISNLSNNLGRTLGRMRLDNVGADIAALAALGFSISAAGWAYDGNQFTTAAFNTSTGGTFSQYSINSSAVWTDTAGLSAINNTQWNDITTSGDGLANITVGWYANRYLYRCDDGHLAEVIGRAQYSTLAGAQAETYPTTAQLPPEVQMHGNLNYFYRVTMLRGASTFAALATINAVYGVIAQSSTAADSVVTIDINNADYALTVADLLNKQFIITSTAALTANRKITVPDGTQKIFSIKNNINSTFTITIDYVTTGPNLVLSTTSGTTQDVLANGVGIYDANSRKANIDNTNLWMFPDATTISLAGLSGTITALTVEQVKNKILILTGLPAGNITIPFPSVPGKDWLIDNTTTGGFTILLKGATATTLDVSIAGTRSIYYDPVTTDIEPTSTVGGAGGHTVQEESVNLAARGNLNFKGANITASDNSGTASTDVEAVIVPVRQTVLYSPIDTSGLPTFLPATSASLVLTIQNVTSTDYLEMTASQRSADVIGRTTANSLSWTCGASSGTNYLPVAVALGGVLTAQTPVTLAPIYQWGGTPAVTNGQYTFNIQQMTMFLGNGTSAPAVNHVIAGECVAGATTITSTVAYALQGRFSGAYTATIPTSANASSNHNIGTDLVKPYWVAECTTAENGYSIGDDNTHIIIDQAGAVRTNTGLPYFTKYVVGMAFTGACYMNNKSTGLVAVVTNAGWKWKFVVQRIF